MDVLESISRENDKSSRIWRIGKIERNDLRSRRDVRRSDEILRITSNRSRLSRKHLSNSFGDEMETYVERSS